MCDELFIVTSVDGETRWAYTTKKEAVKANDKLQPAGFSVCYAKDEIIICLEV